MCHIISVAPYAIKSDTRIDTAHEPDAGKTLRKQQKTQTAIQTKKHKQHTRGYMVLVY